MVGRWGRGADVLVKFAGAECSGEDGMRVTAPERGRPSAAEG